MRGIRLTEIAILVAVLAVFGASGCANRTGTEASTGEETPKSEDGAQDAAAQEQEDDEDAEEAIPVEVAELQRGPIRSVLRFSANLEAEEQVQVFSQARRLVRTLSVEEGDRVERGHVLLRLEDDEQRSALARVQSQLKKAEREYGRQKRLFEQELISDQAFADAEFELEQLRLSVEDARRELGYTAVEAPISGTVTARLVKIGDQVQIGQHLFDVVDFDSMVARVFVPEKHMDRLRPGLTAAVSPAARSDARSVSARVERIAPVVDPQSGTVKVTVAVGGKPGLRPGMYVNVDLVTATHEDVVLVPKRALVYDEDQMFVYRVSGESRVERIFIEPRLTDKDWVEPGGALAAGDRIVIAGQAGLKDGALVDSGGGDEESGVEADS